MEALTFSTSWPYEADININVDAKDDDESSPYDPRPIIIDLRPTSTTDTPNPSIPGAFPFPVDQYAWRQYVPWFLFPDKSVPFDLVVPDPTTATSSSSSSAGGENNRYSAGYTVLAADHQTHPWTTGPPPTEPLAAPKTAALILRHLVHGGWSIRTVLVATHALLASIPSCPSSSSDRVRLPFEPSPILIDTARLILPHAPVSPPLRICDLGCGAGRDLAYLLHTYSGTHIAHATAVDNWKGSIERVTQVARMLGFSDRLTAVRAELKPLGVVKYFGGGGLGDQRFDWLILHRFLPPRSFARMLHSLVAPSGFVFICTFVLPSPDTTLAEWVQQHESPTSFTNLLCPGELSRDMDVHGDVMTGKVTDAQVCASQRTVDKFGWGFSERNGYRVVKEETVKIPDGRTVVWFLAQKVGVDGRLRVGETSRSVQKIRSI